MLYGNPRLGAVVIALLLLWGEGAGAAPPVATVQTVSGTLTVKHKGAAAFTPLAARGTLYVGDVVGTGPDGKAALLFSDGSMTRLNANAAIEITPPVSVGKGKKSLFRALSGEVWARLRPGKAAQTRSAIIGVRGSEFHLAVETYGTTTITVLEGQVDFFNQHGAVAVGESQQSIARVGAAPTAPVTIPNAALIIEWTPDLSRAVIPREKFFITPDRKALEGELQRRSGSVRLQPNDAGARLEYGDALFDSGRFADALKEFQESDRLSPRQAATLTRLGCALMELDRVDEAESSFRAALDADPQYAPALVGLATLRLARDRPAEAQAAAEQAVKADASSAEARIALGLALMRQPGKLTDANAAFQAALAAQPAAYHYQAHSWRALLASAQDDQEAALKEAQTAAELVPQSALAHGNLALVHFFRGKVREAQREARLATKLNPDSVAARCGLGQAQLAQGDVDAAARTAAQAVALDAELPQARYLLGLADAQRRDLTHAERELKQCLRLAPDFLPAVSALARVYTAMGPKHYDDALALLTELLPRHRNTDQVLAALGAVYYQQGRYTDAEAQYREALKLKPNSALYCAELARALLDNNRLSAAIAAGQKAVQLAPGVAAYHATLGLCYDFSGLGSQAEREFREALSLDPRNALARARLALRSPDPKTLLNGVTQAFLFDPAVSSQLLRGGIDNEVEPSGGNEGQRNFRATNRTTAVKGAFHSFGFYSRAHDDGDSDLRNDDTTTSVLSQNMTFITDPRTHVFANVSRVRGDRGLPGSETGFLGTGEDLEDSSTFRLDQGQLATRWRFGAGDYLSAGLVYQSFRTDTQNPNMQRPPDPMVLGYAFEADDLLPELRLDFSANPNPARPSTLTLGAARVKEEATTTIDNLFNPKRIRTDETFTVGYAQLAQRVNDRLSFVAQLRRQHDDTEVAAQPTAGEVQSVWLPSLLATYQAGRLTTLRLFANRRAEELTTLAFAPTETLLTTEASTLPSGDLLGTMRTLELDVERYLPPTGFLKLFVFHTAARDMMLGSFDLPAAFPPTLTLDRVWRTGAGLRYERQLTPNLFGNLALVINRTTNDTLGAVFDDDTAPYHPARTAGLALDYVDGAGTKLRLRVRHEGAFYQDASPTAATRPRFPSQTLVDLMLAKEPTVHTEFFIAVLNLFDRPQIEFNDFPTGRRRVEVGVTGRF